MDATRMTDRPVELGNEDGAGGWLIVCEHASNAIPPDYGGLGLDAAALASHIAWDPGALPVAQALAARLDAPLVAQRFSRLLYDCNRPPEAPDAVPEASEVYRIPGNQGLPPAERALRAERFYFPFRGALAEAIEAHAAQVGAPAVATVHTFTPVYHGRPRTVEIGILHDADTRLADAMLELAGSHGGGFVVRRNEPYGPQDGVTHTLREHALPRGLANVMIEIRNDLVADGNAQAAMAALLARWLDAALQRMGRQRETVS